MQTMLLPKKNMPTKTFLPNSRVTFHPIYSGGDSTSHLWVSRAIIEELEKNQEEFSRALRIVFEHLSDIEWLVENVEIINRIRETIGLNKLDVNKIEKGE
jgi:hypothetical protein